MKRAQDDSADNAEKKNTNYVKPEEETNEMGEFEDPYGDELVDDDDDGDVVVDAMAQENDDGNEEQMEVDVVEEEEQPRAASPEPYIPGTGRKLSENEILQPDLSVYPMLHSFVPVWPSLSFDVLQDNLGYERRSYPVSCSVVAGTQAQDATANELTIMRWDGLGRSRPEYDPENEDEQDDDDDMDSDPVVTYRTIEHQGGVNRVRAQPQLTQRKLGQSYFTASFAETGKVHVFDIGKHLDALEYPQEGIQTQKNTKPIYTVQNHGRAEGFALDWSLKDTTKLLSGDIHSKIFLSSITPDGRGSTNAKPFTSHTSSVEDIQWSPSESTVFASCSADKSIRIWDIRMKERKSALAISPAHESDVNVISWNPNTSYLLLSGGDEGHLKVWDMRSMRPNSDAELLPVAFFDWHKAPVTSVEWHPNEDSAFAASSADNQVTLWDLSVELDPDEKPDKSSNLAVVPDQLLFVHQGQEDIKELHWHEQVPGLVITTALSGFNIFKALPFS